MTINVFNQTSFNSNTKIKYRDGKIYPVAAVDFFEALIALGEGADFHIFRWVRCENCEIVNYPDSNKLKKKQNG